MRNGNGFTPTERRLNELLMDGQLHPVKELHALLWDEQSSEQTVQFHVSNLRKKLPDGKDVILRRVGGSSFYVMMRTLHDSSRD